MRYYIKIETPMGAYWVFTDPTSQHLLNHPNVLFAEAFDKIPALRHQVFLQTRYDLFIVKLVECSSQRFMTPLMRRTLNLEKAEK